MSYDRYVYPGTNILVNKFDIRDPARLETAERKVSNLAIAEMRFGGVTGRFDPEHLKSIHRRIFGAVYGWAGEFRDIEIWKGGTAFVAPEGIEYEIDDLCGRIRDAGYFHGMPHDDTANALTDAMADLNAIHPFREGNGRTQRAFIGQLALNAGYDLDFTKMSENDMRNASMAAARGNRNLMRHLFRDAMSERIYGPGPVGAEPEAAAPAAGNQPVRKGPLSALRALLFGLGSKDADRPGYDGPDR